MGAGAVGDITNTIKYKTSEFSQDEARQTSFRYDLKNDRWPIHTVTVGEMEDEWESAGSGKLRVTDSQSLSRPIEFTALRTGVNRSRGANSPLRVPSGEL